jgi:hypothetical protein
VLTPRAEWPFLLARSGDSRAGSALRVRARALPGPLDSPFRFTRSAYSTPGSAGRSGSGLPLPASCYSGKPVCWSGRKYPPRGARQREGARQVPSEGGTREGHGRVPSGGHAEGGTAAIRANEQLVDLRLALAARSELSLENPTR